MADGLAMEQAKKVTITWTQVEAVLKENDLDDAAIQIIKVAFDEIDINNN
jgi:hypothetical protein